MIEDYIPADEWAALMAFKATYKNKGKWYNAPQVTDLQRQKRVEYWDDVLAWRASRPRFWN